MKSLQPRSEQKSQKSISLWPSVWIKRKRKSRGGKRTEEEGDENRKRFCIRQNSIALNFDSEIFSKELGATLLIKLSDQNKVILF